MTSTTLTELKSTFKLSLKTDTEEAPGHPGAGFGYGAGKQWPACPRGLWPQGKGGHGSSHTTYATTDPLARRHLKSLLWIHRSPGEEKCHCQASPHLPQMTWKETRCFRNEKNPMLPLSSAGRSAMNLAPHWQKMYMFRLVLHKLRRRK